MQRLHKFMDKMQERSVEERRKILFSSMVFFGILIVLVGVSNISSNLVSLGSTPSGLAEAPSFFSSLSSNAASISTAVSSGLKDLNDKLGAQ